MHPDVCLDLAALYDAFGRAVYAMLLRMVRNPQTAEDLTQEAFLRAWMNRHRFDPARGRPAAWLMAVARNSAIDYLRAARPQTMDVPPLPAESPDPCDVYAVRRALARLAPEERRALELAYEEGLTQAEIARRIGRPLGTVKTWVRVGLRNLAAAMG
jgi:RNA polymerase sigma-70 factor (ECF subfamily)